MSTEFFVRGGNDEVATRVKDRYPTASIEKCLRFLCVKLSIHDSEYPGDDWLRQLSISSGEAYWISICSSEEAVEYFHWQNGTLLRALRFNGSTWEVVSGDPEPWEQRAFFFDDDLRQLPSWAKYHPNDDAEKHELSPGPDKVSAKDARNALLCHYDFRDSIL